VAVKTYAESAGYKPKTGEEWSTVSTDCADLSRKGRKKFIRAGTEAQFLPPGAIAATLTQTASSTPKDKQRKFEVGGIHDSPTTSATSPLLVPSSSRNHKTSRTDSTNWREAPSQVHSGSASSLNWRKTSFDESVSES
jgi:hypothetical protein